VRPHPVARRLASMSLLSLAVLALMALSQLACGYALVGRSANIPQEIRRIHVRPLTNQTPRSQVEQFLTNAITDELVTRQRFSVAANAEDSDAEIVGVVTGFNVTPVTFDPQGRATEYEIAITARMVFHRTGDPEAVIWSNNRYVFRENYEVEVSEAGYFDQEDTAIEEVARRFAETMVSDLLEGF